MIKNVTLLLLHITSLSSTSALFSPAAFSQPTLYNFRNLQMSKHFSTFLYLNANRASSLISNSKFSNFLNSVINIHQVELPEYEGVSNQENNPISPRVSFFCNHTSFSKNTSPFNGAAILVHSNINSVNSINAVIEDTAFEENTALMGGAIYYESSSINVTDSKFIKNIANIGSHIFFSCTSSNVEKCIFQEGNGTTSTIELTVSEGNGAYNFSKSNFFLDKGPFRANGQGVTANLDSCCFLDYDEGQYFQYNFDKVFDSANGGKIDLRGCTINDKYVQEGQGSISFNPDGLKNATSSCRLIAYPTATSHYKIKDEPAIFALVAIIFFVLVSIIGIFIVTCKKKKDVPPEDAVNAH